MAFAADTRMGEEYVACGLPYTGFTDGVPQFSEELDAGQLAIKAAVEAAHNGTDGVCGQSGWLNEDLNSGAAFTALYALITSGQKAVYQGLQKAAIDALRRTACHVANGSCDGFYNAFMEGGTIGEIMSSTHMSAARAANAGVKAQYPYPTSY